jgi:hypothetical protein
MRGKLRASVLATAVVAAGLVAVPAGAASPRVTVVADGLESPRGVFVGPEGETYVAEAGTGGDICVIVEFDDGEEVVEEELCFGATSAITRVSPDGTVVDREFLTGLPSFAPFPGEYIGASNAAMGSDGTLYVSVGFGGTESIRDELVAEAEAVDDQAAADAAALFGTVVRVTETGDVEVVADLLAYETDENPDGEPEEDPDSNPNDVHVTSDDRLIAVDSGGNTVLEIDPESGDVVLLAVLPPRLVELPEDFGGGEIPMQSVPTAVIEAVDGQLWVSQLTGFPFPVDGANVYGVTDDPEVQDVIEEGFTTGMALARREGELYVLELARNGLLSGSPTGALVRVREDGTRADLLTEHLVLPGGMDVTPSGAIHITNMTLMPGEGQLLAFDASPPFDPAIDRACPPGAVPGAEFSDIAGHAHEEAIACTAWHGVFNGFPDMTFRPNRDVTRQQFAAAVHRLINASGTELPQIGDGFPDVPADSIHAEAIAVLAEAGIIEGFTDGTFRPGHTITRAQAVSLLVRAHEFVAGAPLPAGDDAFDDDTGSVHEDNIDAAAEAGWVVGVGERRFAPQANIRRGQVATVIARAASTWVVAGELELPIIDPFPPMEGPPEGPPEPMTELFTD